MSKSEIAEDIAGARAAEINVFLGVRLNEGEPSSFVVPHTLTHHRLRLSRNKEDVSLEYPEMYQSLRRSNYFIPS